MKKLWILQKKIKNRDKKLTYVFYLMLNNIILTRIGYIMLIFNQIYLVRINLNKLMYYINLYRGIFFIKDEIYLKFFIIYYFTLLNRDIINVKYLTNINNFNTIIKCDFIFTNIIIKTLLARLVRVSIAVRDSDFNKSTQLIKNIKIL